MLRTGGAVVFFPDAANNPAWDFKVNGVEVQAKCGHSPSLVTDHFLHHPEVQRIVVNQDLANHFIDDPRVIPISGVTADLVHARTEHALHAAGDMVELNLLRFAPVLSVARNGWAMWRGQTDMQRALENVALDSFTRSAGATAGKLVGAAAAAARGGWPAVLVPVFTATAGYRAGGVLSNFAKRHILLRNEWSAVDQAISAWCKGAAQVLDVMLSEAGCMGERFLRARNRASATWIPIIDDWLNRLEAEQAFRCLHKNRFERAAKDPYTLEGKDDPLETARVAVLAATRVGILPADLQAERKQISEAITGYAAGLRRRLLT
jgi:hypothetical protein